MSRFGLDEEDLPPSGARTPTSDDDANVFARAARSQTGGRCAEDDEASEDEASKPPESPVRVKNTFFEVPLQRSPSLERFIGIRRAHSSPDLPSLADLRLDDRDAFQLAAPGAASAAEPEESGKDADPDEVGSVTDSDEGGSLAGAANRIVEEGLARALPRSG